MEVAQFELNVLSAHSTAGSEISHSNYANSKRPNQTSNFLTTASQCPYHSLTARQVDRWLASFSKAWSQVTPASYA